MYAKSKFPVAILNLSHISLIQSLSLRLTPHFYSSFLIFSIFLTIKCCALPPIHTDIHSHSTSLHTLLTLSFIFLSLTFTPSGSLFLFLALIFIFSFSFTINLPVSPTTLLLTPYMYIICPFFVFHFPFPLHSSLHSLSSNTLLKRSSCFSLVLPHYLFFLTSVSNTTSTTSTLF